jgi:hypothetical protein
MLEIAYGTDCADGVPKDGCARIDPAPYYHSKFLLEK